MLKLSSSLRNQPVMSLRDGSQVAVAAEPIINPHNLKILGWWCAAAGGRKLVLLTEDVRESMPNGIAVNDELEKQDVKKFKKISADGKLRGRALEWLLNRPHSEREFRDYLYKKKVELEQIDSLVSEMTEKGYLDNAKFAAWFTELQARRGKSDRAIRAELFKKGIGRELADESVEDGAGEEAERLKVLIKKKSQLSRYKNDPQKLMQYLVGKGFSWQLVKEQLAANEPDQNT